MHLGITEEIFATERLATIDHSPHRDHWSRFRGGSTPDDEIRGSDQIRIVLTDGRRQLVETLAGYDDSQLDDLIWHHHGMKTDISLLTTLHIIGYHESHHQGQAHLTLNLFKANQIHGSHAI